jgi:hypothetical protein
MAAMPWRGLRLNIVPNICVFCVHLPAFALNAFFAAAPSPLMV